MIVLGQYPVEANLLITDAPAGSRINMTCSYEGSRAWNYRLVLVPKRGATERLATWSAIPDETVHLSVPTSVERSDIASIEVRTAQGTPVLRRPA